jgi:uncharacterized coiled-coil protein SlyX
MKTLSLSGLCLAAVVMSGCGLSGPTQTEDGETIEDAMTRIAELQEELDAMKEQAAVDASRISTLETGTGSQDSVLTDLSTQVAANTDAIAALDGRMTVVEADLDNLHTNIVPGLQADIADLEAANNGLTGIVTGITATLDDTVLDLSNLSGLVSDNAANIVVNTNGLTAALAADIQQQQDLANSLAAIAAAEADILVLDGTLNQALNDILDIEAETGPFFDRTFVDPTGNVVFEGTNVHVRSGSGSTDDGGVLLGLGNLIVGYDEDATVFSPNATMSSKTGSHTLVVGSGNSYSSYGGIVSGHLNELSGPLAGVLGGEANTVTSEGAASVGGYGNDNSGLRAAALGGSMNEVFGDNAIASGGRYNDVASANSAIFGGYGNDTTGPTSTVTGGISNVAEGTYSLIAGGRGNQTTGYSAVANGGRNNIAGGSYSITTGGELNETAAGYAVITGGNNSSVTVSGEALFDACSTVQSTVSCTYYP